jgi:hypothetical protein
LAKAMRGGSRHADRRAVRLPRQYLPLAAR